MGNVSPLNAGRWTPQQALLAAEDLLEDIENMVIVVKFKEEAGGLRTMITSKQTSEELCYSGSLVVREALTNG